MSAERTEIARQQVARFVARFDESYRRLAWYAALPLVLTPELLNYLRNHFLRGQTPWEAEVDLLLSELCRPVGYEQFAMAPEVRAWLIGEMREQLGEAPMREVARLLIRYVQQLSRTSSPFGREALEAEQWSAMVYLEERRGEAARQIAESFREQLAPDASRAPGLALPIAEAALARLVRVTEELAPRLQDYPELLRYAADVGQLLASPTGTVVLAEARRVVGAATVRVADVALPDVASRVKPQPVVPESARPKAEKSIIMEGAKGKKIKPRLIVVAGPDGSGKTSITQQLLMHEWMDGCVYVNPDFIARDEFGDWNAPDAVIQAAKRAAEIRERCLAEGRDLAFETVLSTPDKMDFIRRARDAGFFIRLFFVGTDDPSINAKRVAMRVMEGGHDVSILQIVENYSKSVSYCSVIAQIVDRTYVYDNSVDNARAKLLFRASKGRLVKIYGKVNPWAQKIMEELLLQQVDGMSSTELIQQPNRSLFFVEEEPNTRHAFDLPIPFRDRFLDSKTEGPEINWLTGGTAAMEDDDSYDKQTPRLIVIAGPNGSGKTLITQQLLMHEWMDGCVYVNPDFIARDEFGGWNAPDAIIQAAKRAAEIRESCLKEGRSLAFETVLSAPDKMNFIRRARDAGFFIRLFFVGTDDPSINAKRVAMRVMEGGGYVPIPNIIGRYTKSLAYCSVVAWLADRTYVYDNSVDDARPRLLFCASKGRLVKVYGEINSWAWEIVKRLLPQQADDTEQVNRPDLPEGSNF